MRKERKSKFYNTLRATQVAGCDGWLCRNWIEQITTCSINVFWQLHKVDLQFLIKSVTQAKVLRHQLSLSWCFYHSKKNALIISQA